MHPRSARILSILALENENHETKQDLQRALQEALVKVRLQILDLSNAKYPSDHAVANSSDAVKRADAMLTAQMETLDDLMDRRRKRGRSIPGMMLALLRLTDHKARALDQDIMTIRFDMSIAAIALGSVEAAHRTSVDMHAERRALESHSDRRRICELEGAAKALSRARDVALDLPAGHALTFGSAIEHALSVDGSGAAGTISTSPAATIALVSALLSSRA